MVRITITMAAVKVQETGKWRTEVYCYEEDDGTEQVRTVNSATMAILDAIEKGSEEGAKPFVHGKPPEGSVPLWDIWVGTSRVAAGKWVDTCDYRKRSGCPQHMVAKMMEAYKLLCKDCKKTSTRTTRRKQNAKRKSSK